MSYDIKKGNLYIKLKRAVERAKNKDKELKVFGASSHKYEFNEVTTLEKVKEFENKYNIKLPEEYIYFLTEVGNGGTGPFYGIYPLEKLRYEGTIKTEKFDEGKEPFISDNLTIEEWNELSKAYEEAEEEHDDKIFEKIMENVLPIGTQGCTYDNLLILSGKNKGKIAYIDYNMMLDYKPFILNMNFFEWVIKYFGEIEKGYKVSGYGFYELGDEEEILEKLKKSKDIEERKKYITSFWRFNKISQETIDYLISLDNKDEISISIEMLLRLSLNDGIKKFEKHLYSDEFNYSIEKLNLIPEEVADKYYDKVIELLYIDNNIIDKGKILSFLRKCSKRKGKDIVKFVLDNKSKLNDVKSGIYTMSICSDTEEFDDVYIKFMSINEHWIMHTALQGSARRKTFSKELIETYKKLRLKYKDDKTIISNLDNIESRINNN